MELIDEYEHDVEVKIPIGELFEKLEKLKNNELSDSNDDEMLLGVDEQFKVKNEHNEWIDVLGLVTKFDTMSEITFNSGGTFKAASNHMLSYDGLHTRFLKDYKVGESVKKASGKLETITSIQHIDKSERLYDLQVASDTHLYQTSDGLIHHNSIGLVNLSWNYIQMGRDVVYISLELKESKVMKRYITHSAKISPKEIPNKKMEIYNHLVKCDAKNYGRFTVHFYQPNTLTANKLELFVRNYIQKYGTVPIIVLDYAGLMIPNGKNWQGMFERDKYVSEEVRGVATLYNTVVWTADQYNRSLVLNSKINTLRGEIEIKDVTINDYVLTHSNRMAKVNVVHEIQEQECYEITLKSGKKISCSGRHMWPKVDPRKEETFENKIIDNINTSLKVGDKLWIADDNDNTFYSQTRLSSVT